MSGTEVSPDQLSPVWARARAVADAVLYEGYLLYPYRGNSNKNQSRWQWGVLGPPGAANASIGEEDSVTGQFVVQDATTIRLVLRFLQLQHRQAECGDAAAGYRPVDELTTPRAAYLSWDEAIEVEIAFGPFEFSDVARRWSVPVHAPAGSEVEAVNSGRLVRTRRPVTATLDVEVEPDGGLHRATITVRNTGAPATDKDAAIATSLIGTHVIVEAVDGGFVSLLEPPDEAAAAVGRCRQHRCFPVLAGPPGDNSLLLISPIILYDHPEIAEQSEGHFFDATEIDELLTLRVMTMTDEEKAQARATDVRAAELINRCDAIPDEAMARLHGVLRDPHRVAELIPEVPDGLGWWDPLAESSVRPEADAVLINGVRVARGSRVRLRPGRRADAQDLFVAGRTAQVASVHEDVDGNRHIAVTVDDDPAAELHDWYGRYLYFSPEEIEPLDIPPNIEDIDHLDPTAGEDRKTPEPTERS